MLRVIGTIVSIQALAIGVNLVRSKTMAVLLGPEGVGVVSYVDQVVQLVVYIGALGLPSVAIKFLSRSHSRDLGVFSGTYASFLRTIVLLTGVSAAMALAVVFFRPELLGPALSAYRPLLVLGLLSVPAVVLHGFLVSALAAAEQPRSAAALGLAVALCLTTAATTGIIAGGVMGLYWASLVASFVIVAGGLAFLSKRLGLSVLSGGHSIRQELRENPDVVRFTLITYSASFTLPLAYFVARSTVLANFGEAEAGLLQAAIALSTAISLVVGPANNLYLSPILNRAIPTAAKAQAAAEFQRKLTIVIAALAMPMVLFPTWLLVLLFSPSFVRAGQILFLFVVAQCLVQLGSVYLALIVGLDDPKMYAAIIGSGNLAFGVLAWLLVPEYGIAGVALGLLIASLAILLLALFYLSRKHRFVLPRKQGLQLAYGLLALVLTGLIANYYDAWFGTIYLPVVLGKLTLYALFVASLLLFLTHEERRELARSGRAWLERAHRRIARPARTVPVAGPFSLDYSHHSADACSPLGDGVRGRVPSGSPHPTATCIGPPAE